MSSSYCVKARWKQYHLSLRNGSGETIQNESLLAGRALDVVLDDVHHDIVADQLTIVHGLLSAKTVLRSYSSEREKSEPTLGDGVTKHVTSGKMTDAVLLLDGRSLSTLTATGRS